MFGRRFVSVAAIVILGSGLVACDKIKSMTGMGGTTTDFRNAQIDVSNTACSDNGKYASLILQDGKYQLAQYQFELFGDAKHGDVSGHTTTNDNDDAVFVGNCAIGGQTSQILFVYGSQNGALQRLGTANLTENGKGLVQSYDVNNSTILVEQNQGNPPILSKTNYALLNGKLTDLSPAAAPAVASDVDTDIISFQTFHDKLQPYGRWIDHPRWGTAWHPLKAGFRPYENGHWEDSDEYGSVWVSADPWGDAPSHYGRWGYDPNYGGWLWVPGYVWGPSWVVWRADDQNLGWFPMPPGAYDGERDYPDEWASWYGYQGVLDEAAFFGLWSFVPAVDIFAGNIRERIIDRRGYGRFIGRTRNWGHYGLVHGHVFSRAFDHGRFAANFHRGLPGGMRHDFVARHAAPFAAGRRIAEHERLNVGHSFTARAHVGTVHGGFGRTSVGIHSGVFHHDSSFARTGSYHANGFSRSGGGMFGHQNSSGGGSMFGHQNSSRAGGGMFGHQNSGGGGGGMFGHQNSGGSAGGMSGHQSSGGGGGMFGHTSGGGQSTVHTAPANNSGGSGDHHHH